ncbi:DUF2806 domain-containing protein [Paraburkholderia sp. BL9I2N2]|uniref:DUF2806 domain-containing protein n=1 Tax=Paraburkholderia sp. BL9I2N2 TaxID=1938809 RepID=UPI0010429A79|nr:DUF2806 domain-containing protein [Paraburkholderia sp. BL9I2N2]TCK96235.1 uncharacterized protein DUF2806 [Paraburkholderia sp. BL9I2N2]
MTSATDESTTGSSGFPITLAEVAESVRKGKGFDVTISALALTHGVPIPPSIIERIRVGCGRLIDGGFNYVARAVDRRTEAADFHARKTTELVSKAANAGLKQIPADVSEAIAMSFLNEYAVKHDNRSQVVADALTVLAADPRIEDEDPNAVLSKDWLNYFADIAAQKSDPEMQSLMGRILAGEIRRPGSFSPLTIHCLATLTRAVAQKFELLCYHVVCCQEAFFVPLSDEDANTGKGLPQIGLSIIDLIQLTTYGLLLMDTKHMQLDSPDIFAVRGQSFTAIPSADEALIPCFLLTQAGAEIYRLVEISGSFDLQAWVASNLGPRGVAIG